MPAGGSKLLLDPRGAGKAPVLLKHRLDLSDDRGLVRRPHPRRLLPLTTGAEATAGHIQLLAQPGDGMPFSKLINQAKFFGDWS